MKKAKVLLIIFRYKAIALRVGGGRVKAYISNIMSIIVIFYGIVGCKSLDRPKSNLKIIDSDFVAIPSQAPGTYGIKSYRDDTLIGNAAAVAVSKTTFLTQAHVVVPQARLKINRIDIVDYRQNVIHSFDPESLDVIRIVHPKGNSFKNDIGAFIFNEPLKKLTQGSVSISPLTYKPGDQVYIVGNGIRDYRAVGPNDSKAENQRDKKSGRLSFGTNFISQVYDGRFVLVGAAFDTPDIDNISVSGPGDSGGSAFLLIRNNGVFEKHFIGLLQGGAMENPREQNPEKRFFNPTEDPNNPQDASGHPNYAYSEVLSVSSQQNFLQQVVNFGGKIDGFDYEPKPDLRDRSYVYSK